MSTNEFVTHQELELYVGQLTDHIVGVDAKVDNLRIEMHERFEQVDLRFDGLEHRLEESLDKVFDILGSIQEKLNK